jgi:hypothetical protein
MSSGVPHSACTLTVRSLGSQMVALVVASSPHIERGPNGTSQMVSLVALSWCDLMHCVDFGSMVIVPGAGSHTGIGFGPLYLKCCEPWPRWLFVPWATHPTPPRLVTGHVGRPLYAACRVHRSGRIQLYLLRAITKHTSSQKRRAFPVKSGYSGRDTHGAEWYIRWKTNNTLARWTRSARLACRSSPNGGTPQSRC